MQTVMPLRAAVAAVTVVTLGAGTLRAQNTLDTTFAASRGARISVQNMSGGVTVRSWSRNQIRVQAEYDRARVEFDQSGTQLSVRTVNRRGDNEATYHITVPVGTAVEINGLSVDSDISGVCGPVTVNTVSGDVVIQCIDGDGHIQTVSGDVTIADARGVLEATSTSGDVSVRSARMSVTAHSVSGDVNLADIAGNEVDAETVSGDITYAGRIQDGGRYRLAAHSGDVTLTTQGTPNATVSVSTFSGEFASDFPIELQPGTRVSREWEFRLGSGSARMRLNSFSGSITLHRGGSSPREE